MESFADKPQWRWDWTGLCGAEGLNIWSPRHDLGLCFQQLCLQIPVLCILACTSAYFFGKQEGFVNRGRKQLLAIKIRSIIVLFLAVLPLIQIYIDINKTDGHILQISFFLSAVQGICWFTHFLYKLGLRKRLGLSARGPVIMCVIWSLLLVLNAISLRSHYLLYKFDRTDFSASLSLGFSICYMILHLLYALTLVPNDGNTTVAEIFPENGETQPLLGSAYVRFREEGDPFYLGVAMEYANWFSKLLFYWVNPLMDKGVEGKLTNCDDLYDLPDYLHCDVVGEKLTNALNGANNRRNYPISHSVSSTSLSTNLLNSDAEVSFSGGQTDSTSLLRALHHCFWLQFYSIGVLKFIADVVGFAGPMLLNKLVGFIEDKSEDIKWGYIYAAALMCSSLVSSLCDSHFNFLMSIVGLKMRGALVATVYKKTISVSATTLQKEFSVGEIVNFMSTDTDRIVNSCPSFHSLWSIPFQLAVTLYLLYELVGFAFVAGVIFSAVLIPINKLIANKIGQLSTKLMEQKDARVKMITEVLRGIKVIKLYVWEQHFIRLISKLRENELKYLRGRKYLDALCVYFWATTPVVISILTFGSYVLMGNKLTAATVFTGIALLNMLISPLNAFPWVLNGMTEAWVSIKRIQKLLNLEDLNLKEQYNDDLIKRYDNKYDIILRNCGFTWGKELTTEEKLKLHDVKKIRSRKGKGKGKRSALTIDQRSSMESHILEEDSNYVFSLYDISLTIKKGEFVGIIGSVGCGKSSILTAILAELKKIQGEMAISVLESGFGFVCQQPWIQMGTIRDNILFGNTFEDTWYTAVVYACGLSEDIQRLPKGDMTGVGEGGSTLSGGQKARLALARAVYQDKSVYLLDDILAAVDKEVAIHIFQHCIMGLLKDKTRIICTHHVQYLQNVDRIIQLENGRIKRQGKPSEVLTDIDETLVLDLDLDESWQHDSIPSSLIESIKSSDEKDSDSVLLEESSETGSLNFSVYASYWKAIGHMISFAILISVLMMQTSRNMTDWWLSRWVTDAGNIPPDNYSSFNISILMSANNEFDTSYYMKIYVELVVVNTIFTLTRAFIFAYGGVSAASKLHKLLLKSIMKAQSTFFDVSPTGRILNRFSSDTYTIDDSLPFILNILLAQFFGLLGCVFVTTYGMPWICMVLVPLIPIYHWLQNHYRLTSRELKRISSVTLSPVYSHFNETLQGLTTIRAMRASHRFKRENHEKIDANLKAQFASQCAVRWLGLRLQFIGVAIIAGVSFIAVIQHQYDIADPGLVGLAISYALSITGSLSGVVNAFTETEREMIAVERVNQYIKEVKPESVYFIADPPFGWPSHGVVNFKNVVLKYREHLVPSLRNVTFETRPNEKIGIVGRTGAGKSSIISALFRLVEISSGAISIDSVDITRIAIPALRSRLFCIPQDPFLFSGSIRENLDPLNEFREEEIWLSLNKVNLEAVIQRLGGLDKQVEGGGINFSVGQKQLICLARAVLHNAKILCIDEATANVDQDTDRQIQQTLRIAFRKSTVLTIAHRIDTIMDSDRILVLSDGNIVEFDTPDVLLNNSSSHFYHMVNKE